MRLLGDFRSKKLSNILFLSSLTIILMLFASIWLFSIERTGLVHNSLLFVFCVIFVISWWFRDVRYWSYMGYCLMVGMSSVTIGVFCNTFVRLCNDGLMPVLPSLYDSVAYIPEGYIRGGNLLFLGDRFFYMGASIGDILMWVGVVITLGTGFVLILTEVVNIIARKLNANTASST